MALYQPGLGYYARADRQFGRCRQSGSDFVTAPELSPLVRPCAGAPGGAGDAGLRQLGRDRIRRRLRRAGAALIDALDALGSRVRRYSIVDLSGSLRAVQQERLARHGDRVHWLDELPPAIDGVVIGNEVLDAMPVQLLHRADGGWRERGVALAQGGLVWADRPTGVASAARQ